MNQSGRKIVALTTVLSAIAAPLAMFTQIHHILALPLTPPLTPPIITPTAIPTAVPSVNRAPKISLPIFITVGRSRPINITATITDPDNDKVTTSFTLPRGLTVSCPNKLTCKITGKISQVGTYQIKSKATDEHGKTTQAQSLIFVTFSR